MNISRPPEWLVVNGAFLVGCIAGIELALPPLLWLCNLGVPIVLAGVGYVAAFLGLGWLAAYGVKRTCYGDTQ